LGARCIPFARCVGPDAGADLSKSDEYRANANAAECQKMARIARQPGDKAMWLQMAEDWLRMVKQPRQSAFDKFDAGERAQGTGPVRSDAEHGAFAKAAPRWIVVVRGTILHLIGTSLPGVTEP
jgi:hypothetical protein